ncbi:cell cycle progression protein 1 isoform 2-T2 [Rhinophrynus dorsalis]
MSETSSDSESSCGWTIINHEGSDIETLHPQNGEAYEDLSSVPHQEIGDTDDDLASEQIAASVHELPSDGPQEQTALTDTCTNEDTALSVENSQPPLGDSPPSSEVLRGESFSLEQENTFTSEMHGPVEGEQLAEDHGETVSDDSDIVTLETEVVGTLEEEEEASLEEQVQATGDINMSSSFSSQYTFSHPETVFSSQHTADESSNDEASDDSGPVLRRRRSKKLAVSGSESDNQPPTDQSVSPEPKSIVRMGNSLNKCIILALVIAISMGFGHFYGTVQILERQKQVEKLHEHELNDMMDDLVQCQKDQEATLEQKIEADGLMTNLKTTDVEKRNLVFENQHLRKSLEKEEQALSSLQEELRKLREQIRNLEEKGRGEIILSENQKLKAHLKEERQKVRNFMTQKENLLTEAQILRTELDNERQITEALRVELEEINSRRSTDATQASVEDNQEIDHLRERLSELEKKLNFEQQRSDLWERLYIEAKEQNEKLETGSLHEKEKEDGKAKGKAKKKAKETFFSSVKDTFDAMKNSTKDFVRHHKEKIKQAKEAVKENLKKFSDSVKTTFRHFKDSTKNMFDKNRYKKYTERKREETKEANTVRREYKSESHEQNPKKATASQHKYKDSQNEPSSQDFEGKNAQTSDNSKKHSSDQCFSKKGCTGVFECAHQESISLFNKVLDPVRVEEFSELMQTYLMEQVDNFRHWKELEQFINRFFQNGFFIHDQMLFTDFVNDVEDYLENMKEYQTNDHGVFEDLDEFVYRHFFGSAYSSAYGPRKLEKIPPYKDLEGHRYRKNEQKNHQYRSKREGKWHKHGCANGRHMADVEIELGQLPFDPKY